MVRHFCDPFRRNSLYSNPYACDPLCDVLRRRLCWYSLEPICSVLDVDNGDGADIKHLEQEPEVLNIIPVECNLWLALEYWGSIAADSTC